MAARRSLRVRTVTIKEQMGAGDPEVGKTYCYSEMGYNAIVTVLSKDDNTEAEYITFRLRLDEKINWPLDEPEFEVGYSYSMLHGHKFAGGSFYPT